MFRSAFLQYYENHGRPYRLFRCREAQGSSSEILEMGDLSRWQVESDPAIGGLFRIRHSGQSRRKGSAQADVERISELEHDAEKCEAVFGRHHALTY